MSCYGAFVLPVNITDNHAGNSNGANDREMYNFFNNKLEDLIVETVGSTLAVIGMVMIITSLYWEQRERSKRSRPFWSSRRNIIRLLLFFVCAFQAAANISLLVGCGCRTCLWCYASGIFAKNILDCAWGIFFLFWLNYVSIPLWPRNFIRASIFLLVLVHLAITIGYVGVAAVAGFTRSADNPAFRLRHELWVMVVGPLTFLPCFLFLAFLLRQWWRFSQAMKCARNKRNKRKYGLLMKMTAIVAVFAIALGFEFGVEAMALYSWRKKSGRVMDDILWNLATFWVPDYTRILVISSVLKRSTPSQHSVAPEIDQFSLLQMLCCEFCSSSPHDTGARPMVDSAVESLSTATPHLLVSVNDEESLSQLNDPQPKKNFNSNNDSEIHYYRHRKHNNNNKHKHNALMYESGSSDEDNHHHNQGTYALYYKTSIHSTTTGPNANRSGNRKGSNGSNGHGNRKGSNGSNGHGNGNNNGSTRNSENKNDSNNNSNKNGNGDGNGSGSGNEM